MAVGKGEVGGDHDLLRCDRAAVGQGGMAVQGAHKGVLPDVEPPGDSGQKIQRMNLGLPGKLDRSGHGEGELQLALKDRRDLQTVQGRQLPVQPLAVVPGVHIAVRVFEAAVQVRAQTAVLLHRLEIGLEVKPGPVLTQSVEQFRSLQPVLSGDLGGGAEGDAAADGVTLHQQTVHAGLLKIIGAEHAGDSAADDEHIGVHIALQGRKTGQNRIPAPNRIHRRPSWGLIEKGQQTEAAVFFPPYCVDFPCNTQSITASNRLAWRKKPSPLGIFPIFKQALTDFFQFTRLPGCAILQNSFESETIIGK